MREVSTRLPWLILLLAALWIVVFWMWPGPGGDDGELKISIDRDGAPDPVAPVQVVEESDDGESGEFALDMGELEEVSEEAVEGSVVEEVGGEEEVGIVPPSARVYVSQQGDTFEKISQRFYGTINYWRAIARMNDVDPNRLGPGTRLLIPLDPSNVQGLPADEVEEAQAAPEEPAYAEYIVSRGDTLSEISMALYGRASLWRRIAEANPGIDPDRLRPGTVLKIPPPPARDE